MQQNRPKSRLVDRRKAMYDITQGINETDLLLMSIDAELRRTSLDKFEQDLKSKNYDSAFDDIARLDKNFKDVDKKHLYGMIIDNVDKELEEIMSSTNEKSRQRRGSRVM